jgi:hypothetical protein
VISRPTTEQILLDCRRELLDVVLPDAQSDHVRVSIQMLENVLRNAATRSAHEIAWMREETVALETFAREVQSTIPERSAETSRALQTLATANRDSLHLDDVIDTYSKAGEAFSCALEAAMEAGHTGLTTQAADLCRARNERELEIKGEWAMVGRG